MKQLTRILIVQPAFIGDAILVSALAESLHADHPEAEMVLVVRQGNEQLFEGHPFLTLWVWEKRHSKYRNLFRLLKRIRHHRFDVAITPHRFFSGGILVGWSGASSRRGFGKNPLSGFFTTRSEHVIGTNHATAIHEVDRNYVLVADLCTQSLPPKLYPRKSDVQNIDAMVRTPSFITIAPASVWFTKQWPLEKWVELTALLPDVDVYLLGGPNDHPLAERLKSQSPHQKLVNLCGKLTLLESAELMRRAAMNYVNDSAPLHLCSAVEAKVTAVFCSTIPGFGFGPYGSQGRVVEYSAPLACRPCGLHGHRECPKGHFKCAMGIQPSEVLGTKKGGLAPF